MRPGLIKIVVRSLRYHKSGVIYLIMVIALLTAVITGSLSTGNSVRNSLRKTSLVKLGKTGTVISSPARFFDPLLVKNLSLRIGSNCTGLLEIKGYCTRFPDGLSANDINIFAVDSSFFSFHGVEGINIEKGEAVVNEKLAEVIGLRPGDEVAVHFKPVSDLPADAPFAPERNTTESIVLRISAIAGPLRSGDFSLGISQITPLNIFLNLEEIPVQNKPMINRLLVSNDCSKSVKEIYSDFKDILGPESIGVRVRKVPATEGCELISDRIFIDQPLIDMVLNVFPSASPVITYLSNHFISAKGSTPYSFVSALPSSLYDGVPEGDGIIISKWLANDLSAAQGDTITMSWYSPDPLNHLAELSGRFVIKAVRDMKGVWSDSLLMPEFPGIAGKESCTDWDAGVNIDMKQIRKKDELYWNRFRGLPKAFINYETGRKIWGNNFGPATSIRFPEELEEKEINNKLEGAFDPFKSGFSITDLPSESLKAASKSVDFSTLFLSLGFFLVLSAAVLLVLVTGSYFESKRSELNTLLSLGFSDRWIRKYMLLETFIVSAAGALAGCFLGWLFNATIIKALNTVWQGSVQTDTLSAGFDPLLLFAGFIISEVLILIILTISLNIYLKKFRGHEKKPASLPSSKRNMILLLTSALFTFITLFFALIFSKLATILSFAGGVLLFVSFIVLLRHYFLKTAGKTALGIMSKGSVSGRFYSFNSEKAITPVIFIAAGLFAVIITGVNRLNINDNMLKPSGGTGGYLLWGEAAIPVLEDLNSRKGKREFGLDETDLKGISFVQAFKASGNDASCLNLNHITAPPLLGLDPAEFIRNGAFSFSSVIKNSDKGNPWDLLNLKPSGETIFGIADQTVLQYGLKIKTGDTLSLKAETGQTVNIVIAAGLKSSVFQGYVVIGRENFKKFFPSISGSQVFLVNGDRNQTDLYRENLNLRLANYGVRFEPAADRLASFFVVTNTYLSVFSILGGIGVILGVIGLGFILLRNFSQRKKEFGLMMSTGFSISDVRRMVFMEQAGILLWGVLTGVVSSLIATLPSLLNSTGIPWITLLVMIILVVVSGIAALSVSLRSVRSSSLIASIRNE